MIGAYAGERADAGGQRARRADPRCGCRRGSDRRRGGAIFGGAFVVDSLRPLHEGRGADRLRRSRSSCAALCPGGALRSLRVPGARAARHARHAGDDLGERSHHALSRPGDELARALMSSRRSIATMRGRARRGSNISCSARSPPGMLLYGASLVYGFTGHTGFEPIAAALVGGRSVGLVVGLVFVLAGPRLQDLRRAVPHVDARRLRGRADAGDRVLRLRAEARGDGAHRARRRRRLPADHARLAADRHLHRHRLDGARRLRRDRADQHQAADGLFLDRPYGLRAGRARRRHGAGRAGRDPLHRDLRRDDARRLRRDPRHAPRRPDDRGDRLARRSCAHQAGDGVPARHDPLLARRNPAARRLLREILRLPRRRAVGALSRSR